MKVVMNFALSLMALSFLHNFVQLCVNQQQLAQAKKASRQRALSLATQKNRLQ
jgi:hypothetical protein